MRENVLFITHSTDVQAPPMAAGAALITSLAFLTLMTLFGLTAASTSLLQQRMAGHLRDQVLAFEGAEAALRAGEHLLREMPLPISLNSPEAGLYHWQHAPVTGEPNWRQYGEAAPGLAEQPRYFMEQLPYASRPPTPNQAASLATDSGADEYMDHLFRITARASGGTTATTVVLQSTFRP